LRRLKGRPLVSVALPVRNTARYLDCAVESILSQTLSDLELLIVDDASDDETLPKALAWERRDARVRVQHSEVPLGHARAANLATSLGTAPLIARQDADDWSHPRRLETQVSLMEPGVALVGSVCDTVDEHGRLVRPPDLARLLLRTDVPPVAHTSVVYRREHFEQLAGYREQCVFFEDQDLYLRLSQFGKLRVQTEPMVQVRNWSLNSRNVCDLDFYCSQTQRMLSACKALRRGEGMSGYEAAILEPPSQSHAAGILYGRCTSPLWRAERSGLLSLLWKHRAWPRRPADLGIWAIAVGSACSPALCRRLLYRRSLWVNRIVRPRLPDVLDWWYPWQK
jgi:glycosyltransferase involved in cell wall biosynthesis